jgi:hypothetical protein
MFTNLLMLLAGAAFTSHCINNLHPSTTVAMLQQDLNIGEVEGDVLKQVDCVASSVSTLCTTYKELAGAAAAAASKGDTTMARSTDGVADHTEPVAEQQEQMSCEYAAEALILRGMGHVPLRVREIAAVHSSVTDAIAGNRGASVLVRGPAGSGKYTALFWKLNGFVKDWCKQHGKLEPVLDCVHPQSCERSAGLYGAILQQLKGDKRLQIGEVSEAAAEAKKQLEDLVFSSDVPLIVVKLYRVDDLLPTYSDQLQQLFE